MERLTICLNHSLIIKLQPQDSITWQDPWLGGRIRSSSHQKER